MFYIYLFLIIFIPLIALVVEIILAKSNLKFFLRVNILISSVLFLIGFLGIVITNIMLNDVLSQAIKKSTQEKLPIYLGIQDSFYQYLFISLIIILIIIVAFLIKIRLNIHPQKNALVFCVIFILFVLNFLISFTYSTMVFSRDFDIIFYIMLLSIVESFLFHIPIAYAYFLRLKASTIRIYTKKTK